RRVRAWPCIRAGTAPPGASARWACTRSAGAGRRAGTYRFAGGATWRELSPPATPRLATGSDGLQRAAELLLQRRPEQRRDLDLGRGLGRLGQARQQVGDQLQAAGLLVVEVDQRPACGPRVRRLEHAVARAAVLGVLGARLQD